MFGIFGSSIGYLTEYEQTGLECGWSSYYLDYPIYEQSLSSADDWVLFEEKCVFDFESKEEGEESESDLNIE